MVMRQAYDEKKNRSHFCGRYRRLQQARRRRRRGNAAAARLLSRVMDDFIARAGGRIFNTAGDAVLAEFSSAVEAVRCAIDIQESLRTRNMAYPASRQMSFRIGITVGDVVERDGDLLGDGVNIAARLEGIAPVGGICISRTVYEQVANKLSVQFADIGEQQVKNIPTPVHAYKFEMRPDDLQGDVAPTKKPAKTGKRAGWIVPVAIARRLRLIAIAVVAYLVCASGKSAQPAVERSHERHRRRTLPAAASAAARTAAAGFAASRDAGAGNDSLHRGSCRAPLFATNICRRPITRRSRSAPVRSDSSPVRPMTTPQSPRRSIFVRSARMRCRSSGNASSMRSATPSCIRAAARRCRQHRGYSTIRPIDAAACGRQRHPAACRTGQGGESRRIYRAGPRAESAGARARRAASISSSIRKAPTRRCAGCWNFAAITPACRAWSLPSTTISSCRSRRR